MATIVHTGPYDNLSSTYQTIYDFLQENNYQIIAPSREIYLNSPENQSLAQLLTEIQFPIEILDSKE